jgi:hypothetical protein
MVLGTCDSKTIVFFAVAKSKLPTLLGVRILIFVK